MQVQVDRQHVLTKKKSGDESHLSGGGQTKRLLPYHAHRDFEKLPLDLPFEEDELDTTLRNLEIDDYFDITRSDKKANSCIASTCKRRACSLQELSARSKQPRVQDFADVGA